MRRKHDDPSCEGNHRKRRRKEGESPHQTSEGTVHDEASLPDHEPEAATCSASDMAADNLPLFKGSMAETSTQVTIVQRTYAEAAESSVELDNLERALISTAQSACASASRPYTLATTSSDITRSPSDINVREIVTEQCAITGIEIDLWKEVMKTFTVQFCSFVDPTVLTRRLQEMNGGLFSQLEYESLSTRSLVRERPEQADKLLSHLRPHGNLACICLLQALYDERGAYRTLAKDIIDRFKEVFHEKERTLLGDPECCAGRALSSISSSLIARDERPYAESEVQLWRLARDTLETQLPLDSLRNIALRAGILNRSNLQASSAGLLEQLRIRGNESFDTVLSGMSEIPQLRPLAYQLNALANNAIPARAQEFPLNLDQRQEVTVDVVVPRKTSPATVLYEFHEQLLEVDLKQLCTAYQFSSGLTRARVADIIRNSGKSLESKRRLLLNELLSDKKVNVEEVIRLISEQGNRNLAKKITDALQQFRRSNLIPWHVIPLFSCHKEAGLSLLQSSNGDLYLQERPSIQYHTDASTILQDYTLNHGAANTVLPPKPANQPSLSSVLQTNVMDRDLSALEKPAYSTQSCDIRLETVALIGARDATESYCCHHFASSLTPDQYAALWPTNSNDGSTIRMIINRHDMNLCQCYLIVELHDSDDETIHQQLLHKATHGSQSLHLLYRNIEVGEFSEAESSSTTFSVVIEGGEFKIATEPNQQPTVQQATAKSLRSVYREYPIYPLYRYPGVPLLHVWPSMLDEGPTELDDRRLAELVSREFFLESTLDQGGGESSDTSHKDSVRVRLPVVSVSSQDMSLCHPSHLCRPVQSPTHLWLHDMTVPSPITLLASLNKPAEKSTSAHGLGKSRHADSLLACTAFPCVAEQICDQLSSEVGNCYHRIDSVNPLESLRKWPHPVTVVTCLSQTEEAAFHCLNTLAGASFSSSGSFSHGNTSSNTTSSSNNTTSSNTTSSNTSSSSSNTTTSSSSSSNPTSSSSNTTSSSETSSSSNTRSSGCNTTSGSGNADGSNGHPVSCLLACTRFTPSRLFVLLAFTGITMDSIAKHGLEPGQRDLLLSAIALSRLFLLDVGQSQDSLVAFGKEISGLSDKLPFKGNDLCNGLDRLYVDKSLFQSHLAILSSNRVQLECLSTAVTVNSKPTAIGSAIRSMFSTVSTTTYDLSTMSCPSSVQDCDRRLSDSRVHGDILAGTAYSILRNPRNPIKLFADGGSFLACQNLLLALATTSFHSFQGLHEMDIFHISQLRVKLAKFCETGVDDDPSVMIDTENLSYTHERVKKELLLPALHLSADEDTATKVVSQIKDGLQRVFGVDSTINKRLNLVAAVQWCLKDIVARRCKHAKQLVTNYLEIEDCSFIDKSFFEDTIDIFRLSWVLCGD
ncbi:uncharacterized protein LOC135822625 isoform X2 [Sycon ciliatum]